MQQKPIIEQGNGLSIIFTLHLYSFYLVVRADKLLSSYYNRKKFPSYFQKRLRKVKKNTFLFTYLKKEISSSIKAWEMPREERNNPSWKLQAHKHRKIALWWKLCCNSERCFFGEKPLRLLWLREVIHQFWNYSPWKKKNNPKPNQSKRYSDRMFNEKVIEETC